MSRLLHPLLAGRWTPTRFDSKHEIAQDEIEVLLEIARGATSLLGVLVLLATAVRTNGVPGLARLAAVWTPLDGRGVVARFRGLSAEFGDVTTRRCRTSADCGGTPLRRALCDA